jgi:hypothetical protein
MLLQRERVQPSLGKSKRLVARLIAVYRESRFQVRCGSAEVVYLVLRSPPPHSHTPLV